MKISSQKNQYILKKLQTFTLFQSIDFAILETMIPNFHYETCEKDRHPINSTATKDYFYIVISGRIKISRIDIHTGKELTLFLLASGDVFDIVCLLDGQHHDVLTTALDTVEVVYIPNEIILQWLDLHPEFNRSIYPYMGQQMRYLENLATNMTFHDTITRLSRLILHYAKAYEESVEYKVKLINDLSHEELANMIGTVRSVVSRHLSLLHKEKSLETSRKEIIIKDCQKLLKHAKKSQDCLK
ncbi:MAG: cAMP receptor protein [uncultured Sulfurovum sp.]|uniref:cAMP receptor protein n=1 Tax=uncultured Sulfurovum sp. TaxID=269237 RepID=A0A6S6UC31_9BACT|nr:MAG: cAMP receptor protein [uncultured Sulfurovum sp.]